MSANNQALRSYDLSDQWIGHVDIALKNIFLRHETQRDYPAKDVDEGVLSEQHKQQSAALMRVNHAGEMAAQALYQGQSMMARDDSIACKLQAASMEESDHLNWCRSRLDELGEPTSKLDPFWYAGSFVMGVTAGAVGDRWNLGFLAETEHQVVRHLESHLQTLPEQDARSRAIVTQMCEDEQGHADLAEHLGAAELPKPIQGLMKLTSKVMTTLAKRF
ncbi:MAG: 2-polyprenyl-3-methyl-6-methoxy-1,4-benzoquinone monooxygenase [Mariprofundaceae bacterium]|nr:2-polyprenyl-3-methyl-6-methoxy-1,4-benzoquinone monooxygenase [Mariprofundaceae bacterium]